MQNIPARALRASKKLWLRWTLKGATPEEMAKRLELLYQVGDPWHLQSDRETARFRFTNELILRYFPATRTLLEVGSGEGHQTEFLLKVASEVHAIEISPTAVTRARTRVPSATFYAGDLRARPWGDKVPRFDLVVACEMLYYLPDPAVREVLATMGQISHGSLVTFFEPAARRLAHLLPAHADRSWFHAGGVTWLAAWWKNP